MSVASFVADDLFRFTIVKCHSLNPSDSWANTYEFQSDVSGSTDELLALANKLVLFERGFMFDTTVFLRAIVSTWQADSAPYDPDNFISSGLTSTGMVTPASGPMGVTTVLHVLRNAPAGRTGHLFYRNCLAEGDVSAPAGKNVLVSRSGLQSVLDGMLVDSDLLDYVGLAAAGGLHMCLVDAAGAIVRPVLNLFVQNVTQIKTDHKWYNRTGSP